jgi:hypothetical protein
MDGALMWNGAAKWTEQRNGSKIGWKCGGRGIANEMVKGMVWKCGKRLRWSVGAAAKTNE